VWRYLAVTAICGLTYGSGDLELRAYYDADYVRNMGLRRSTTGYVFFMHGGAVLRITDTCYTLQGSHVLRALASKIASQSSLKSSPQIMISNKFQPVLRSHTLFATLFATLQPSVQPSLQPGLQPYLQPSLQLPKLGLGRRFTTTIYNRPLYRFGSCESDGRLTIDLELPLVSTSNDK
jgi:hypothetical protein